MQYETFLFTRIKQRDFTAFVRPSGMTNKEISVIARALNYINNVTLLKPEFPGLYCFALGEYLYLLRHYDSGRKHAGREIGVIEGIAVERSRSRRDFTLALPHFITRQAELLNISGQFENIDVIEPALSPQHEWSDEIDPVTVDLDADAEKILDQFARRRESDWLLLPFDAAGLLLLLAALMDFRMPPLYFAFGTNSEAADELARAQVSLDMLGYFTALKPGFKARDITRQLPAQETAAAKATTQPLAPSPPKPLPRRAPTLREPVSPLSLDDTQPSRTTRLKQRKYMTLTELMSDFVRQMLRRK